MSYIPKFSSINFTLEIDNSRFSNIKVRRNGGAMKLTKGLKSIKNSIFERNSAYRGSSIYESNSTDIH